MKPTRPSLEALAAAVAPKPEPAANVVAGLGANTVLGWRRDKPHVSLYLAKAVQREIKRIAIDYDRKPHDFAGSSPDTRWCCRARGRASSFSPSRSRPP